jgi:hypothetical protein
MIKTIGDYWRSCNNEELAANMVDFLVTLLVNAGISEKDIDMEAEYAILKDFFNTEYEDNNDSIISSNSFSYLH